MEPVARGRVQVWTREHLAGVLPPSPETRGVHTAYLSFSGASSDVKRANTDCISSAMAEVRVQQRTVTAATTSATPGARRHPLRHDARRGYNICAREYTRRLLAWRRLVYRRRVHAAVWSRAGRA